jgi:hypothetical protein
MRFVAHSKGQLNAIRRAKRRRGRELGREVSLTFSGGERLGRSEISHECENRIPANANLRAICRADFLFFRKNEWKISFSTHDAIETADGVCRANDGSLSKDSFDSPPNQSDGLLLAEA